MKGKNILATAACVLGFGGIVANTCVGVATSRELNAKIDEVAQAAKEADEANKATNNAALAAAKAELQALIQQTSASIKAAYEAADANLTAGLNQALVAIDQAKTTLKTQLEDEMDAKDAAVAAAVLGQLESLANSVNSAITSLGTDVTALKAFQTSVTTALTTITSQIADLEDAVDELYDGLNYIAGVLSQVIGALNTVASKVGALETAFQALTSTLANEYLTTSEVTALVGQVNSAVQTLAGYMLDSNGDLVTMQNVLDLIADINVDASSAEALIQGLQDQLTAFNGDVARQKKADLVLQLEQKVAEFEEKVNDAYDEAKAAYESLSADVTVELANLATIKADLLSSSDLAEMKQKIMAAIAQVILAQNVAQAEEVVANFVGLTSFNINKLNLEKAKALGLKEVEGDVDTTGNYQFTSTQQDYFSARIKALAIPAPTPSTTLQEAEEAYQELLAEIDNTVIQAKGYADLCDLLNAQKDALDALAQENTATRKTTAAMLAGYEGDLDALAAWADYKTACEATHQASTNTNGNGLISYAEADAKMVKDLLTAEDVAAFNESLENSAKVVVYVANVLDKMLVAQEQVNTDISTNYATVIDEIDAAIVPAITQAVADAVAQNAYDTAVTAIKADEANDTNAKVYAAVDEYIAKQIANVKYEGLVAHYLFDVKTAAQDADDDIDALTNIATTTKDLLKGKYDDLSVPTLAGLYSASNKGTADQFDAYEDFAEMLGAATADIDNVVRIAKSDDAAIAASALSEAAIAAKVVNNAEADAIRSELVALNTLVEEDAYYAEGKSEIRDYTAGADLKAIADAAEAAVVEMKARQAKIIPALEAYDLALDASKVHNNQIADAIDTLETLFPIQNNNNKGDGDAVLTANAAAVEAIGAKYTVAIGTANDDVPPYEIATGATAADAVAALEEFQVACEALKAGLDAQYTAFQAELDAQRLDMVEQYNQAEAATLVAEVKAYIGEDGEAGTGTVLGDATTKIEAYMTANGVSAELIQNVRLVLAEVKNLIAEATMSDQVKNVFDGAMAKIATKLGTDVATLLA